MAVGYRSSSSTRPRPNNSLQRTRLRRGVTGRSLSQTFGLATVRVYHRRAAELNRSAVTSTSQGGQVISGMPSKAIVLVGHRVCNSQPADRLSGEHSLVGAHPAPVRKWSRNYFQERGVCVTLFQPFLRSTFAILSRPRANRRSRKAATLFLTNSARRAERCAPVRPRSASPERRGQGAGFSLSRQTDSVENGRGQSALRLTFVQRKKLLAFQGRGSITSGAAFQFRAAEQLVAADSGVAAGSTGQLDSQRFGFTILLNSHRRCR